MAQKRKQCDLPAAAAELPEQKKRKQQVVLSELPAEAAELPEQKKPRQQVVLSELPAEAAELPEQKKPRKSKHDRLEELRLLRIQKEQGAPLSNADNAKLYRANVKEGKKTRKPRK